MDDVAIVDALRAGDSAGVAELYRAYADRLFAYCASMLRDRDAASDAVHDTFVVAWQRAQQLRDPSWLRSWVYAIARNECLRTLRDRGRTAALEEAGEVSDDTTDLGSGLRDEELRSLVWAAADGLNPREREVLDLSVRHELDGTELAAAVGVSPNQAAAVLSTARKQLERALSALVVARTGRGDCPALGGMLAGWDGAMTVLLRKRVVRHIESCAVCTERKRSDVSATALLGMAPLLAAPAVLRARLVAEYGDPGRFDEHARIADRAGRFEPDGFPVPLDRVRGFAGWQAPAVAGIAVLTLLVGGFLMLGNRVDEAARRIGPTPSPSAAPRPSIAPGNTTPPPAPTTSTRSATPGSTEPEATSAPPTTSNSETTSTPPTSEPPSVVLPADVLNVTPGSLDFSDNLRALVEVSTTSSTPVDFTVVIPADAPWLVASPTGGTVDPDEAVPVLIAMPQDDRLTMREPCTPWTVVVAFEPGATVTVTGDGRVCLSGSSISPSLSA